jgi:lysophospholipase L1-like esterase
MNCLALINLFNFLENNLYNYRFVLAKEFSDYATFNSIIKSKHKNFIALDNENPGIADFVTANNLNKDIIHPTVAGHEVIGKIVIDHIKEL